MNIVKELRENAGMQQKDFAIRIGVSQPTISEWEHQKKDPSGDRLVKIAELFGITTLEVLGIPIDPAQPKKRVPTDEELRFALFGDAEITDQDFEDVKRYAQFVVSRKNGTKH